MFDKQVQIADGDKCKASSGIRKGNAGIVEDLKISKGGNLTVTVRQADGTRFKTLARSVEKL